MRDVSKPASGPSTHYILLPLPEKQKKQETYIGFDRAPA